MVIILLKDPWPATDKLPDVLFTFNLFGSYSEAGLICIIHLYSLFPSSEYFSLIATSHWIFYTSCYKSKPTKHICRWCRTGACVATVTYRELAIMKSFQHSSCILCSLKVQSTLCCFVCDVSELTAVNRFAHGLFCPALTFSLLTPRAHGK